METPGCWRRSRLKQSFLSEIAASVRRDVRQGLYEVSQPVSVKRQKLSSFFRHRINVIAEIKPRSPTAGVFRVEGLDTLAAQYEAGGACGISVLAEHSHFGGSVSLVSEVARSSRIPVLFKDFVVCEEQLVSASRAGSSVVLLIAELFLLGLADQDAHRMVRRAHELGLEVLFEAHTPEAIELANSSSAEYLGINNRNLETLELDKDYFSRAVRSFKKTKPLVAESGYTDGHELERDKALGADAFLVGSHLMESSDPVRSLKELISLG